VSVTSPPDIQHPAETSPRREYTAWVLIALITALIAYSNTHAASSRDGVQAQTAVARFRALMLIATNAIEKRFGMTGDKRLSTTFTQAVRQIEQDAQNPEDKLRAAVIAGELIGKERALAALEALLPQADPEVAIDISALGVVYTAGPRNLSVEDRERLILRHRDFARIALAFGVPAGEEPRKSIEQQARLSLIKASIAGLGLLTLAGLSITFCMVGVVLQLKGSLRAAGVNQTQSHDSYFLKAFAAYLILLIGLGLVFRLLGLRSLGWNWLLLVVPVILLMWIARHRGSVREVLNAVGLHAGRGWSREIAAGLMGYVAGLVVVVPGFFVSYLLVRASGTDASHPIVTEILSGSRWQLLGLYGVACIVAPASEETMFRGILFHHLRSRWNWPISAVIVSFLFAILHPQGWAAVPALAAIALVLSGIREWRGSLVASAVAHSFNNFIALTFAVLLLR
jgi:membrane protease YdiL (CAAX protease family)